MHPMMRAPRKIILMVCALACLSITGSPHSQGQAAVAARRTLRLFWNSQSQPDIQLSTSRAFAPRAPTKLRRCEPGELGSVISRYSDVAHHDWVMIPLIPYFILSKMHRRFPIASIVRRYTISAISITRLTCSSLGRDVRKGRFLARRMDPACRCRLRTTDVRISVRDNRRAGRCIHQAHEQTIRIARTLSFSITTVPTFHARC